MASGRIHEGALYTRAAYDGFAGIAVPPTMPIFVRKAGSLQATCKRESLNKLMFYGIGQGTSRSALAYYGMRETIAGGNAAIPLWKPLDLQLFGEANAAVCEPAGRHRGTADRRSSRPTRR